MLFRKHLSGKILSEVKQNNFDRVITFVFQDYNLIFELFSHGNIILTDKDMKVIFSFRKEEWKDRSIKRDSKYEYPKQGGLSPLKLREEDLIDIFNQKDIVRSLVKNTNLSGPYAEEVCQIAGINKNKEKPDPEEIPLIFNAIKALLQRKIEPCLQDGEIRPFALISGGDIEKKYPSLNEAIDDIYFKDIIPENPKLIKLENRLKEQEKSMTNFEDEIIKNKEKAELLRTNYPLIDEIIKAFKRKEDLSRYNARREKDKIIVDLS